MQKSVFTRLLMAIAAAMLAASCGTPSIDSTALRPGWRSGIVVQVSDRAAIEQELESECDRSTTNDHLNDRYVKVQYLSGRHTHYRVFPISSSIPVKPGDTVYFKRIGCSQAVVQ